MNELVSIGGSDVAAICGFNKYENRFHAWMRLTGKAQSFAGNELTEWGNRLESAILDKYAEVNQCVMERGLHLRRLRDGWKRGSPDGLCGRPTDVPITASERWGVDAKNINHFGVKDWTGDEVPTQYLLQCQWYMHVFDLPRWDLAVLFGGNSYHQYPISRLPDVEAAVVAEVEKFRTDHLLTGNPPPFEMSEDDDTKRWLESKLSRKAKRADAAEDALIGEYQTAWQLRRAADANLEAAKKHLIEQLCAAGVDEIESSHGVIKYRSQLRRAVDWDGVESDLRASGIALSTYKGKHTTTKSLRVLAAPRAWGDQ